MASVDNLVPCGDRILVELAPQETVTKEGLILPTSNKAKQNRAVIVALGSGSKQLPDGSWLPWTVSIGDTVLLVKYAGIEIGDDHLLVAANDIVAVIR